MVAYEAKSAEYRYITTDLLTNSVLAEIPFKGVTYERALKAAGKFSGNIAVTDQTESMDLYNSTMPGKTGLYVLRDGVCVWGGIIWDRSYNVISRTMSVSADEFTSYLYHRRIWKTWMHDFGATIYVRGGTGYVVIPTGYAEVFPVGSSIDIDLADERYFDYEQFYRVTAKPSSKPSTLPSALAYSDVAFVFSAVSIPTAAGESVTLPDGDYEDTTITVKTNTYDYIRALIEVMGIDFRGIEFADDIAQPGLTYDQKVISKAISGGQASLKTEREHSLVPGQEFKVYNVGPDFDGLYTVVEGYDNVIVYNKSAGELPEASVLSPEFVVSSKSITNGIVTLQTVADHGLYVGQVLDISGVDAVNEKVAIYDGLAKVLSIPSSKSFTYASTSSINQLPTTLTPATVVKAGSSTTYPIIAKQAIATSNPSQSTVTLTTAAPHGYATGDILTTSNLKDEVQVVQKQLTAGTITYTTSTAHGFAQGNSVQVSGVADAVNVTNKSMTIGGGYGVFTVTTDVPHNLLTGDTFSVSNISDTYSITNYEYTKSNKKAKFTTSVNHNMQAGVDNSVLISGLPGQTFTASSVSASSGQVTINTTSSHSLTEGTRIEVSGFSGSTGTSYQFTSISRVNGVTTATFPGGHPFSTGDYVYIYSNDISSDFWGSFQITSTTSTTIKYNNPVAGSGSSTPVTLTLDANQSAYYDNYGRGSGTSNTGDGVYTYKWSLYQGNPGTAGGIKKSAVRFESIDAALAGAGSSYTASQLTISKLELYLKNRHSYNASGLTAYLAMHNDADLYYTTSGAAQTAPSGSASGEVVTTSSFTKGQGKWTTLPSTWIANFQAGTAKGILVGLQTATSTWYDGLTNYGYFDGYTMADPPKLRITYTTGTSSDASYTGISGYVYVSNPLDSSKVNGSYTISAVTSNTISYYSGVEDFSGLGSGTSVFAVNILSANYLRVIERTDNTFTVETDAPSASIPSTSVSGATAVISSSVFNVETATVYAVPSSTQLTYRKAVSDYIKSPVVSTAVSPYGSAVVQDPTFNGTFTITSVPSATQFRVSTPSTKTVALSDVTPVGTAISTSALSISGVAVTVTSPTTFSYAKTAPPSNFTRVFGYATAASNAKIEYGSYGSYTANSDLLFEFENEEFSIKEKKPEVDVRGHKLLNIGEYLDSYSDDITGFDYRIDCEYDAATNSFKRIFKLIQIQKGPLASLPYDLYPLTPIPAFKGNVNTLNQPRYINTDGSIDTIDAFVTFINGYYVILAKVVWSGATAIKSTEAEAISRYAIYGEHLGQFATQEDANAYLATLQSYQDIYVESTTRPLTAQELGADIYVFEFPGNISNLDIKESAENSATRFFMVGNSYDTDAEASDPYAAATATDLLNPINSGFTAWPLLDDDDSDSSLADNESLYAYADRYLQENRPPNAEFTVTVNGSIQPIVGTYQPGDWCSLIINDNFVAMRLATQDLEPRDDVLIRRINSYSVSVPDSVTFPEAVTLNLIPEWQVDKIG